MLQESIFNLIPKEYVPSQKEPIYRSAYPNGLAPTLIDQKLTIQMVSLIELKDLIVIKVNQILQAGLKVHINQDATMFRMKNTGTMGSNQLPEVQSYKYPQNLLFLKMMKNNSLSQIKQELHYYKCS